MVTDVLESADPRSISSSDSGKQATSCGLDRTWRWRDTEVPASRHGRRYVLADAYDGHQTAAAPRSWLRMRIASSTL
jgi:hypothetical protein